MFRLLLGALFLLSSAIPAFAETFSCTWCRGRGMHFPAGGDSAPAQYIAAYPGGLTGAVALSVIYPGLIVLMTMTAQYCLSVAGGDIRRDRPDFARNAATLSALWLIGFFPFLSTALGGFLFCFTGVASIAGWAIVRRCGFEFRLWERLLVLWSFFFFSLAAGVIAAGYGRVAGAVFDQAWQLVLANSAVWGPFSLAAVNAGALWLVFDIAGIKVSSSPETFTRLKVYAIIVAVAVLDAVVMENHSPAPSWLAWPLLALPSAAYYGVYWLVARLPESARARTAFVLFTLLSLFLMLLACFAAGAPGPFIFVGAAAIGFVLSLGRALGMLWGSRESQHIKIAVSLASATVLCSATWLAAWLQSLAPDSRADFVANTLLPDLLGLHMLVALLPAYGFGVYLILAQKLSRPAGYALAAVMAFLLLLGYACANLAA